MTRYRLKIGIEKDFIVWDAKEAKVMSHHVNKRFAQRRAQELNKAEEAKYHRRSEGE